VSRRLRRLPALLLPLVLGITLVACGDDEGSSGADGDALHGITVTGELGEEPKVEWDGRLEVEETATSILVEGEDDEVAKGDQVEAYIWIGNGFSQEKAYSDWDNGGPETLTVDDQVLPVLTEAIIGERVGTRIAITTTAEEMFGEAGNAALGVGNKDSLLVVIDLMEKFQAPEPKDVPADQLPSVVEKGGKVTGLDFSGIAKPKPKGDLLRSVIKEGDGEELTTSSTVKVNYLGQVHGAKKPFDESYSGEPIEFSLQGVVQGWTYGLAGLKVGSRVLLQIPPALGYGSAEQGAIPANSTLFFVVDIISAS